MNSATVLETNLPGLLVRRGKVRDVYDLGEYLLVVSTDRITLRRSARRAVRNVR